VDDANSTYDEVVDVVMDGMEYYKGTGSPTFYTTVRSSTSSSRPRTSGSAYLRQQDRGRTGSGRQGDRHRRGHEPTVPGLIGIIVNLDDYNVGTDRGGELTMFDDFDIDYNQQKYLLETRLSGALIHPKSALVIRKTAAANVLTVPAKPTFVADRRRHHPDRDRRRLQGCRRHHHADRGCSDRPRGRSADHRVRCPVELELLLR
jgi:hypothetical protein